MRVEAVDADFFHHDYFSGEIRVNRADIRKATDVATKEGCITFIFQDKTFITYPISQIIGPIVFSAPYLIDSNTGERVEE